MSTIPTITEHDIRTFIGEQNFLKGRQLVRDGAIVDPEQQGMALKAYCDGSLPEPYRVQVTFDGSGITAALCSCSAGTPPYGTRGCEHATAARFARQRDYANAAAIYAVVAMQTLSHYLSYHDEDGALGRVVQDCVEGLGACLGSEREDATLREQILEAIYAVYCFDIDHGGFGLTRDFPPAFLQCTTPEEKHPRASIDLYQQHVERLIAGRGRANYQVACSYLAKIRSLYQKLDETEEWTNYIAWLRKQHSRLSTLKKELAAAGLEGEIR